MDRRRWIARAAGSAGAVCVLAARIGDGSARAARARADVRWPVEAFRVDLSPSDEAEIAAGVTLAFARVTADDRCPADLDCDAPGSAEVIMEVTRGDGTGNFRTSERTVTFQPRRPALAYDDETVTVVASLSGDSGIDRGELVLTLVVLDSAGLGLPPA